MKYSLVLPIYNEEENIAPLFEHIIPVFEQLRDYEIIAVDDGSKDKTFNKLLEYKKNLPQLKIIKFETNSGQSAAFEAGFFESKGELIITMDADLQNPPEDIPKLIAELQAFDMICGWRKNRKDTGAKKFASRFANSFRGYFLKDGVHDTGCSLKVMRRSALIKIKIFKGMHRFLPALFKIAGFKVTETEVSHLPRKYGVSKYRTFGRAIPAFIDLLAVLWMRKRYLRYKIEKIV